MDRVFLDANVLFSAAYAAGSGLARLWKLEGVELVTSGYALAEAVRNLEGADQRSRLAALMVEVTVVSESATVPPGCGVLPVKDRSILSAAVSAGATHLLTGDVTHFGRFFGKVLCGVRIERPAAYLAGRRGRRGRGEG